LTLGGGIGHLMRAFGLTIDSLRSCEVVIADGDVLTASADDDPELFWALRGGGGNFGIVTSFEFDLHPLGPTVMAGMLAWPMDAAPEVLTALRDLAAVAPDEVGIMGNLRLAPPLPAIPAELHGTPIVALLVCHAGPVEDAERALAPLFDLRPPAVNALVPKPYVAHQTMLDAALPHGRHYYWKSWKLPPLHDELIATIVEHAGRITSPMSTVPIFTQGGAVARVPQDATAYPSRDAAHDINMVAAWLPEDPDPARHLRWCRDFWDALRPHSSGAYVNFLADEPAGAVERAYGAERFARLRALKAAYDPTNFFRQNHNIEPAQG
jgi:FAD/FMN-containing dehydrogenase